MKKPHRRLLPLNQLRAFEAAARHASFTKAAEELGVTQGAVSRHIRALEERLGFPLFSRTAQGLQLSHGSHVFALALEDAYGRIARATDNLIATHTHSVLTVRGYTTFFIRWLIPRLPQFQRLHPEIEVRLVAASDPVDFDRDAVDVGIRYGRGQWRHWSCDLLFLDELSPICSPDYLAQRDASSPEALLRGSTLLHHNLRPSDWAEWCRCAHVAEEQRDNLYFEDLSIVYECARANLGIAIGQRSYVEDDLMSGRLIEPFGTVLRRDLGYHLVTPLERADAPKIQVFRAWLAEASRRPAGAPGGLAQEEASVSSV
ncbi:LysR family transcriptional regulator [Xanthobacter dioxanivorans]|uniref:LysR family transcriptional regulator n=1 Tax=Xanthobacter dioxanivorans TaxID=2528964 RepID=A0A974PN75_9HYPH|nr:LysR substrate-binding domain-containing protein [Xanthobacter dioxanivorans]QRG06316.1 LysR family transcriptional regulator [Xanthobacter dioxanivorans]